METTRALIVEDDSRSQFLFTALAQRESMSAVAVSDGQAAVREVSEKKLKASESSAGDPDETLAFREQR